MKIIKNYFFEEEEWKEMKWYYKTLLFVTPISIIITILAQI